MSEIAIIRKRIIPYRCKLSKHTCISACLCENLTQIDSKKISICAYVSRPSSIDVAYLDLIVLDTLILYPSVKFSESRGNFCLFSVVGLRLLGKH